MWHDMKKYLIFMLLTPTLQASYELTHWLKKCWAQPKQPKIVLVKNGELTLKKDDTGEQWFVQDGKERYIIANMNEWDQGIKVPGLKGNFQLVISKMGAYLTFLTIIHSHIHTCLDRKD